MMIIYIIQKSNIIHNLTTVIIKLIHVYRNKIIIHLLEKTNFKLPRTPAGGSLKGAIVIAAAKNGILRRCKPRVCQWRSWNKEPSHP